MNTTLDGRNLFDEQQPDITLGSVSRSSIERTMGGLDGVLSIDLGQRGRKIKQTGVLHATSRAQIKERINSISSYMDGDTHTLVTRNGEVFDNLRIDVFKVSKERAGGGGIAMDYEIIYTQLKV